MEGPKLHKESKRIIAAVKKAGTPNYSSQVNVGKFSTFETIVAEVAAAQECATTFIMLGAIEGDNLWLATSLPSTTDTNIAPEWLADSISGLNATKTINGTYFIRIGALEFAKDSSDTPFKAIDQAFSLGSAWLRKKGLVVEEEEEHEYGFDDIGE